MAENGALSFGVAPYAEGTSSTKFVGQIITSVVIFVGLPAGMVVYSYRFRAKGND